MSESAINKRYVLLHGGGMDSSLLLYEILRRRHDPIYHTTLGVVHIDYGQLAAEAEFNAIEKQLNFIKKEFSIDIPYVQLSHKLLFSQEIKNTNLLFTGNLSDPVELPGRNGLLVRRLALALKADDKPHTILVGAEPTKFGVEPLRDCTAEFFNELNITLSMEGYTGITVKAPFLSRHRGRYDDELFDLYNLHREFASHIMSCWIPKKTINGYEPCGECPHCKKELQIKEAIKCYDDKRAIVRLPR